MSSTYTMWPLGNPVSACASGSVCTVVVLPIPSGPRGPDSAGDVFPLTVSRSPFHDVDSAICAARSA
ncbi:hypothetical protein QP195_24390, partial [Escherichia coli]|nr:hypothetical protein [Escherichia coli]